VADHQIDARSQTGTAPDEKTEMRYPTRASELVHRRLSREECGGNLLTGHAVSGVQEA
jgi:hypothetical protein